VRMSKPSRKEYMKTMTERYGKAKRRKDKSAIINEIVSVTEFNRKYVLQQLNGLLPPQKAKTIKKSKPFKYQEAMPAIEAVWRVLDYPCAERLHPVLLEMVDKLAQHGHLFPSPLVRSQLMAISRPTLGRRIAKWVSQKPTGKPSRATRSFSRLRAEIPVQCYDWDEKRPGALEVDLVEHNGGSSQGSYAYTLTMVDIVTGYSRRRAIANRSQAAVFQAIEYLFRTWPMKPWGIHSDNGSEFMSGHLRQFCQKEKLTFTRSRPYRKNDNAHVEQKNRQYVREVVGYERYETPQDVDWLNAVYACLDTYANLFLPMRKVISKTRINGKTRKGYDTARTTFQRLIDSGMLAPSVIASIQADKASCDPLRLHENLEKLIHDGPQGYTQVANSVG
jgi:transposase InsO family protein